MFSQRGSEIIGNEEESLLLPCSLESLKGSRECVLAGILLCFYEKKYWHLNLIPTAFYSGLVDTAIFCTRFACL